AFSLENLQKLLVHTITGHFRGRPDEYSPYYFHRHPSHVKVVVLCQLVITVIRIIIIVVLLSGAVEGLSQSGSVRQALRALEKEKWQKSRTILQKALRKDS